MDIIKYSVFSGSRAVSGLFHIPKNHEQGSVKASVSSRNGIFIGNSLNYNMPVFLDAEALMNPHMFVLGMSGGGKTYLLKSLMLKMHMILGYSIVVIDMNGEYENLSDIAGVCTPLRIKNIVFAETDTRRVSNGAVMYYDLRQFEENKKIGMVSSILRDVERDMRSLKADGKNKVFIFLDEAWKFLKVNNSLEAIVREGRKYGVGLVMASQLIEDIDVPMLSNSSAFFIFRIQNKNSLNRLSKNYELGEKTIAKIQNLEVGTCLLIQTYKSSAKEVFFVKRVSGVALKNYIDILFGANMIEINQEKFEELVKTLSKDDPLEFIRKISTDGEISLSDLIKSLIKLKADRREILKYLKKLGVEDVEMSDAFAMAING